MGGAPGLRAARCEPFGSGLSGTAREQPAIVGVGPARTVGGVLWGPRGTRTANGRGVRPLGSGTRLEPSSADRPHLGWVYDRAVVGLNPGDEPCGQTGRFPVFLKPRNVPRHPPAQNAFERY